MTINTMNAAEWARMPELHKKMGGLQLRGANVTQNNDGESIRNTIALETLRARSIYDAARKRQSGPTAQNVEYCYSIDMLHLFD